MRTACFLLVSRSFTPNSNSHLVTFRQQLTVQHVLLMVEQTVRTGATVQKSMRCDDPPQQKRENEEPVWEEQDGRQATEQWRVLRMLALSG